VKQWVRFGVAWLAIAAAASAGDKAFDAKVLPILRAHCVACHSGAAPQANLDLQTSASILKGGKSGPAIRPGAPTKSLLLERVVSRTMPPGNDKLGDAEIAVIRGWIEQSEAAAAAAVTEADVLPVFQMRCTVCHGKRKREGGLDLRTRASVLKGGTSGAAVVPGDPGESLVMKRILAGQMPPPKLLFEYFVRPPSSPEVELIRRWIEAGVPPAPPESQAAGESDDRGVTERDRQWWSFQPPKRPEVPAVRHQNLVRNAIDSFLLAKLEAKGLSYSEPAPRLVLMRRVYLDLTGLPPAPADVEAFERDTSPNAYENLVDRLLDSRHYGERWAQFWLNNAGYSDSEGIIDEDKIRPNAWRYRDYVIRSLIADKPYDRFLTEQIAGDELVNYKALNQPSAEDIEKLTATGFLRLVPDGTYSPANGSVPERMNVIADEIEVLGSTVMGLTIGCARCHDHKYDPIPQRDYYRFSAILQSAYDPYDWVKPTERNLDVALEAERTEVANWNGPIEAEIKAQQAESAEAVKPLREQILAQRLAGLPEGVRTDLAKTAATDAKDRSELQKYLADKFADVLKITEEDLAKQSPEYAQQALRRRQELAALRNKLKPKPEIRALYEMGGEPSPVHLLRRGDANSLGEAVRPAPPSVIRAGLKPYEIVPPHADATGRRLALARWLTQPDHPLTARVIVNRLWMHHFGKGIVASTSNFGKLGVPPSHPELLDWLATDFVRVGWSLKKMHRLMVTSSAYRQTTRIGPRAQSADPENVLLSRMPLRRMDAEQLHDSILAVTGQLDAAAFGAPVLVETAPGGEIIAKATKEGWRRNIYVLQRRTTPPTMLEVFDQPPMAPNCIERSYSTVSTQALQMMNSEAVRDRARFLAGRLVDEFPGQQVKQIESLYLRALARHPTSEETAKAVADLDQLTRYWQEHLIAKRAPGPRGETARWSALASLCHAVLSSAEFAYID
jgi:hypothetical protein